MSWREAPLYIEVHDLTRRVLEWTPTWSDRGDPGPVATTRDQALALVDAVSLALTFPDGRLARLAAADASIVRVRMRLRLAHDRRAARGGRAVGGRGAARPAGGWRRARWRSVGGGARAGLETGFFAGAFFTAFLAGFAAAFLAAGFFATTFLAAFFAGFLADFRAWRPLRLDGEV